MTITDTTTTHPKLYALVKYNTSRRTTGPVAFLADPGDATFTLCQQHEIFRDAGECWTCWYPLDGLAAGVWYSETEAKISAAKSLLIRYRHAVEFTVFEVSEIVDDERPAHVDPAWLNHQPHTPACEFTLDRRELATILAALRFWKEMVLPSHIATEFAPGEVTPLAGEEIDVLCDRMVR